MRLAILTAPFALVALFSIGCGHDNPPPKTAAETGQSGVTTTNASSPSPQGAVSMSEGLKSVCGISDTGAAPKFDFDSVVLSRSDRSELDQLSKCMTTGPLAGKNVELVGRADPRGEAEYNMTLGATRANAVKHYLAQLGVASSRLTTTSRGALDASGTDESTWAIDRHVDLELATR